MDSPRRDWHRGIVFEPLETHPKSFQLQSRPELPKHVTFHLVCVYRKRKAEEALIEKDAKAAHEARRAGRKAERRRERKAKKEAIKDQVLFDETVNLDGLSD